MKQILVIMHGALGDWIFATAAFEAVREHHNEDHITLLTTSLFKDVATLSPFFNSVWIDDRPKFYQLHKLIPVLMKLRSRDFDTIYDFKNNNRTSLYKTWMRGRYSTWSEHRNKKSDYHVMQWREKQLNEAGIKNVQQLPNIKWMDAPIPLPSSPFVLLIPGCAAHRSEKRWSEEGFVRLAQYLRDKKITPVLVGKEHFDLLSPICTDLTGKTQLSQLSYLAAHASFAIGGDTGPTHLVAARGAPTLFLYGSDEFLTTNAPRGPKSLWIKKEPLSSLTYEEVTHALQEKGWL